MVPRETRPLPLGPGKAQQSIRPGHSDPLPPGVIPNALDNATGHDQYAGSSEARPLMSAG